MKTIICILCIGVFAFSACKKDKIISGRVYNLVTGDGIEASQVQIFEKLKNGRLEGKSTFVYTNFDGMYLLEDKFRASKAQGIRFENYNDSLRFFVPEPRERKILNGEGNVQIDFPIARLVPITLFFTDSAGNLALGQQEPVRFGLRSFHTDGYYPKGSMSFYTGHDPQHPNNTNASTSFLAIEGWNYVYTFTEDEAPVDQNANEVFTRDSIFVDVNGTYTQSFNIQIKD